MGGGGSPGQFYQISYGGGRIKANVSRDIFWGLKWAKKCHVLLEWPLYVRVHCAVLSNKYFTFLAQAVKENLESITYWINTSSPYDYSSSGICSLDYNYTYKLRIYKFILTNGSS
jgi:hypothetical protein